MGCDAKILEPKKPFKVDIRCHMCGRYVWYDLPIKGHESCVEDGVLRVNYETENIEDR